MEVNKNDGGKRNGQKLRGFLKCKRQSFGPKRDRKCVNVN